jgi:hypothetical protein
MPLAPACVGRIVDVSASCGCTLTKTTITGLSPEDIEALSYKEIYLTKAILSAKEAKMLGVPERGLMELLTSKVKNIKDDLQISKISQQSIVMPYIQRQQRSFINANYFTIETGQPTPGAGVGSLPASAWNITVNLGQSWLKSDLTAIERYFVPGSTLIVLTWDNQVTKVARTLVFTIVSAVNADVGATDKAVVTVYPNVNATTWAGYNAADKLVYQPVFGVAQTGANSVSDYESYCPQQPADLSNKLIVNWLQTTRESYCRESSYEEVLDQIMKGNVNDYLKAFKTQSIADQEKYKAARYRREFYNSVFYGAPIDIVNQTTANWQNLPKVYDVANGTCPLAYKASSLGIFTQLANCNRVVDLAGAKLNLDYIFQQLYYLRRNREASGDAINTIDSMTDRYTAGLILEVMSAYYKARYDVQFTKYFQASQTISHDNVVLFNYNIYDVQEAGVQWAVFVDDYFNDLVDAFATPVVGWDFRTRARNLWFIDWSDINIGVAGESRVTRRSPANDTELALYQCVISPVVKTYDLRSKTWTTMVDRPDRHLIIHNFALTCPKISDGFGCVVPQS